MCKQKLNIRFSDQPHAAGYSGAALAWESWVLPEMLKGHPIPVVLESLKPGNQKLANFPPM